MVQKEMPSLGLVSLNAKCNMCAVQAHRKIHWDRGVRAVKLSPVLLQTYHGHTKYSSMDILIMHQTPHLCRLTKSPEGIFEFCSMQHPLNHQHIAFGKTSCIST